MKRFQISEAEYKAIQAVEKGTKDKNVSRRLRVLMLSQEGYSAAEEGQAITAQDIKRAFDECAEKVQVGDTSICCWNVMDGERLCRDRSIRRLQMKRRVKPQKN